MSQEGPEHFPVQVRDVRHEDLPFIFSTWLQTYRDNSSYVAHVPKPIYFAGEHRLIEKLLRRGTTKLAVDPLLDSTIYGYVVSEDTTLHYVFVKYPYRKLGIARKLLMTAPRINQYSHYTASIRPFVGNASYNPYAAEE